MHNIIEILNYLYMIPYFLNKDNTLCCSDLLSDLDYLEFQMKLFP